MYRRDRFWQHRKVDRKYPIAEIFTSLQGEGLYTGTMMTFIRLAGCSVGKPRKGENSAEGLPEYIESCRTWDGRPFLCDTDFRTKEVLGPEQILEHVGQGVERICLTGGEPLNHDLEPLVVQAAEGGLTVHVETSGTVELPDWAFDLIPRPWITASPKYGMLPAVLGRADEIKLLVDERFSLERARALVGSHPLIYLQPVNAEHELDRANVDRCLSLLVREPRWRMSTQSHKIWGMR